MKKKIISLIVVFIITLLMIVINKTNVQAVTSSEFFELQFEIINNEENENVDIYLLLPKKYIEFAIQHDNLDLEYEGINTLKDNTIPSIDTQGLNIQDEIYEEDGIEYIQILLEKNRDNIYSFDILSDYPDLDMKFRIKNENKDFIVHIDNFIIDNNICEIQYNYDEDIVKQPDKKVFSLGTIILIIILVVVIIFGIVSYINQKNNN